MPGMTTMPILQSAPPASSGSRPLGGNVAPAASAETPNTPDIPAASNIANNPGATTAAKMSSSSTAPSAEAGSTPESFADALQRHLNQITSTDAPPPESLPLLGLAQLIPSSSNATISPQPAAAETLLADLSGLADRYSSSGNVPAVADDPAAQEGIPVAVEDIPVGMKSVPVMAEGIQDLPTASALPKADLKGLPAAKATQEDLWNPPAVTAVSDISVAVTIAPSAKLSVDNIEDPAVVGGVRDATSQVAPVEIPSEINALRSASAQNPAGPPKEDDSSQEISPYGLASIAAVVQSIQLRESVQPDSKVTANDTSSRTSELPRTPALPASAMAQSIMDKETPPAATSELPAEAGKSAEFAATQTIVAEARSTDTVQSKSSDPEKSFEALLAAAQTFSQHRNNGVHAANAPGVPLPVHTPVGTRGWDGEVSDKLVWMVGRQEQRAELVLNPPQMGRIEVSLSVNDGQTSALFASANPTVRDALEAALPRLREILADAGISLGQTQVGADTGNNAGNSSTSSAENRDNPRRDLSKDQLAPGDKILRQLDAPQWLKRGNGLVDTFA